MLVGDFYSPPHIIYDMCTKRYYPQYDGYLQPNMHGFKLVQDESDFDRRVMHRCFAGRMTKARYKKLERAARIFSRSPRYRCGHDWDCCGCLCGQYMTFTYSKYQVVITFIQSYNY